MSSSPTTSSMFSVVSLAIGVIPQQGTVYRCQEVIHAWSIYLETKSRVPNGPRKTGLDQLVRSKVKSSLMVEIRPTGQSGLSDSTRPGLVRPGPPSSRICTAL